MSRNRGYFDDFNGYYPESVESVNGHLREQSSGQPTDQFWSQRSEDSTKFQKNEAPKEDNTTNEGIAARFASTTSLQGVAFIHRSQHWYSRAFWVLVFLTATGAAFWQTYLIFTKYYKRDTTTSVNIGYAKLAYPSVTFCNLNPIRQSAVNKYLNGSDVMTLVEKVAPRTEYNRRKKNNNNQRALPPPQDGDQAPQDRDPAPPDGDPAPPAGDPAPQNGDPAPQDGDPAPPDGDPALPDGDPFPPAGDPAPQDGDPAPPDGAAPVQPEIDPIGPLPIPTGNPDDVTTPDSDTATSSGTEPSSAETTAAYAGDDYYYDDDHLFIDPTEEEFQTKYGKRDIHENVQRQLDEDYGYGEQSESSVLSEKYRELMSNLSRETRQLIGHQVRDMIISCSINGRKCSYKNFTEFQDVDYGNCFTFNSVELNPRPIKALNSGIQYGLNMLLYLEEVEHVRGLSGGRGSRFAVHAHNTMPFVGQNGISASSGEETFVGIKLLNMTRLGQPYTTCGDGGVFNAFYNGTTGYTVEACINTCVDRTIASKCGCYRPEMAEYYYKSVNESLPACETAKEINCTNTVRVRDELGNLDCGCNQACRDVQYEMEISSNAWPTADLWFTLIDSVCARNKDQCAKFKDIGDDLEKSSAGDPEGMRMDQEYVLRKNFQRVTVYYRDLNFETITEKADYELVYFRCCARKRTPKSGNEKHEAKFRPNNQGYSTKYSQSQFLNNLNNEYGMHGRVSPRM
ncbi:hypothetical protein CAPTEDRAFT_200711 [Capitella teleta]|uniref:Uncharacterized protein n=1 Tax=Capitella teleta TaxID=283909 RepID=R7USQ5_CAPTE|nr:hypothetical protein CAPTEDRAFT_200711 [Capitella teleta]|eukprot:ELU09235.1 hypothetical protein CAPTEDRAFT_200711 [Capitella teleta]